MTDGQMLIPFPFLSPSNKVTAASNSVWCHISRPRSHSHHCKLSLINFTLNFPISTCHLSPVRVRLAHPHTNIYVGHTCTPIRIAQCDGKPILDWPSSLQISTKFYLSPLLHRAKHSPQEPILEKQIICLLHSTNCGVNCHITIHSKAW